MDIMNMIWVAIGYLLFFYPCSGTQLENGEVTLNNFTDELLMHSLSFMPASLVCRTTTVSQRFNVLSSTYFRQLFFKMRADGTSKIDVCKVYQYYHEVESSPTIRVLTYRTLHEMRPSMLSCESFKLNSLIDYFCERLFADYSSRRLSLRDWDHEIDTTLHALIIKHKDTDGLSIGSPSEKLIDAVGYDKLRALRPLLPSTENLTLEDERFVKGGLEFRKKVYRLHQPMLSKSLQALIETENIFDSRLLKNEIGAVGLVALADFSTDETAFERALELAETIIRTIDCSVLANVIKCIGNTKFLVGILKARRLTAKDHLDLAFVLYLRKDAQIIFRAINEVETIQASIQNADETVEMWLKIAFGLIMGIEDQILLPLIVSLKKDHPVLGAIAAYHMRSLPILLALRPKSDEFGLGAPLKYFYYDSYELATLDLSLKENILLMEGKDAHYLNFITLPRRIEYFTFMLENANDEEIVPVLNTLNHCASYFCTDEMFRIFIKRCISSGRQSIYGGVPQNSYLQKEIRKLIKTLLKDGLDCSKMFVLKPVFQSLDLPNLQRKVFEEVLSWKNGFNRVLDYLCSNNDAGPEDNALHFFQICLLNDIGFEIPEDHRPLILVALTSIMNGCNRQFKRIVFSNLEVTFKSCKMVPVPSTFHEAVAETISSQTYMELMTSHPV